MTDLQPDDHARLRRTFQQMDELAPLAPSLDSLPKIDKIRGSRRRSKRLVPAVAGAAVVLVVVGIVVVAQGPRSPQVYEYEASVVQDNGQDDAIAFLSLDISSAQRAAIEHQLETLVGIRSFSYIDKDAVWAEFKEMFADHPGLLRNVDPDILPTQYRLALADDANVATIVSILESMPGVRKVVLSPSLLTTSTT
jgi:hypothetical protein